MYEQTLNESHLWLADFRSDVCSWLVENSQAFSLINLPEALVFQPNF